MSDEKKTRVSDVDFVKACLDSKSNDEVASKVGLKKLSVAQRANKLRKAGVQLPKYPKAYKGGGVKKVTDVAGLNDLVASLKVQ